MKAFAHRFVVAASAAVALTAGFSATAQDGTPPAPPSAPADAAAEWQATWTDGEIQNLGEMLTGAWQTVNPVSDGAAGVNVVAQIGPVTVEGVPNALYAEFARADDLDEPYYQAIFGIYRAGNQLRLRTYEFRLPSRNRGVFVGGWAFPHMFPAVNLEEHLMARMDIVLNPSADGYSGASPHPYPTARGGALEMTSQFRVSPTEAAWTDRGFDAQGRIVWGPAEGAETVFAKIESPVTVERRDNGLVVIDYRQGDQSIVVEPGDGVDVHYAGWTPDTNLFQTSRDPRPGAPNGQAFSVPQIPVPGRLIEGWNEGVPGMAQGGTRRLIIPSDLGYGARGQPAAGIPGDAILYFRVDAMLVRKPAPAPDPEPAPGGNEPDSGGE